jgi:phage repressor protein C with HTH and peptisase S24 domain
MVDAYGNKKANEALSNKIKKLRQEHGLTQAELASLTGISQNYLSQLERGVRSVSLALLLKLADVLKTSVQYLTVEGSYPGAPIESNLRPIPQGNILQVAIVEKLIKICAGNGYEYAADCQWQLEPRPYPIVDGVIAATHSEENLLLMGVEGNSMEPNIYDGDMVLFDKIDPWVSGNLIVANYNGKNLVRGIIKQNGKIILRAKNKEYEDIIIGEEDEFYITGRVLKIVPAMRNPEPVL